MNKLHSSYGLLLVSLLIPGMAAAAFEWVTAPIDEMGVRYGNGCVKLSNNEVLLLDLATEAGRAEWNLATATAEQGRALKVRLNDAIPLQGGCDSGTTIRTHDQIVSVPVPGLTSGLNIARDMTIDWIAASANTSSTSHFVRWAQSLPDGDCASGQSTRTRFSVKDEALFSLLLSARMTGKKVGLYYVTTPVTDGVPGHGTDCQLVNAWIESDT